MIPAFDRHLKRRSLSLPLARHFQRYLHRTPRLEPAFNIVDTAGLAELDEFRHVVRVSSEFACYRGGWARVRAWVNEGSHRRYIWNWDRCAASVQSTQKVLGYRRPVPRSPTVRRNQYKITVI